MMVKILENIIKLIPKKSKLKIAKWVEDEHPLIWEQAKAKTQTDEFWDGLNLMEKLYTRNLYLKNREQSKGSFKEEKKQ